MTSDALALESRLADELSRGPALSPARGARRPAGPRAVNALDPSIQRVADVADLHWWEQHLGSIEPAEALSFDGDATAGSPDGPRRCRRLDAHAWSRVTRRAAGVGVEVEDLLLTALLVTLERRQPWGSATVLVSLVGDRHDRHAWLPMWLPPNVDATTCSRAAVDVSRVRAEATTHWVPSAHLLRGYQRFGPGGAGVATGRLRMVPTDRLRDTPDTDPPPEADALAQVVLECRVGSQDCDVWLVAGSPVAGETIPSSDELGRLLDEVIAALDETTIDRRVHHTDLSHPDDRPDVSTVSREVRGRRWEQPRALALETEEGCWSFAQLDQAVDSVCLALHHLGVRRGDLVGLRFSSGAGYVIAMTACLRMGVTCLSLPTGGGTQAEAGAADLNPRCWVAESADELEAEVGSTARLDVSRLVKPPQHLPEPFRPSLYEEASRVDDLGHIMFSSGTTGRPKAIPQRQGGLAEMAAWLGRRAGVAPGMRVAGWAAPGYDAGICEVYVALTSGATLLPVPGRIRANPRLLGDWLRDRAITHLQTVPSFLQALVHDERGRRGLAELEVVMTTGEMLTADLAERLLEINPRLRLINLYGPTEVTIATHHEIDPTHLGADPLPVGQPVPGREVLVIDRFGREAGPGIVGEIVVRGPYVSAGYLGTDTDSGDFRPVPDLPQPRCGSHHSYRTGDLGRWSECGDLVLLGRRDRQIKFNGVRIELGAVEGVIATHPQVAECAVVPTTRHGAVVRLEAQVVPTADSVTLLDERALARELRTLLREHLGGQCPPITAGFRAALRRNTGGKLERQLEGAERAFPIEVTGELRAVLWAHGLDGDDPDADLIDGGRRILVLPALLDAVAATRGIRPSLSSVLADPRAGALATLLTTPTPSPIDSERRIS